MSLLLPNQNQIDPRAVWTRAGTAGDGTEIYLVCRDRGDLVSEHLPHGCGMLPYPLQPWFNQLRGGWGFRAPRGMTEDEALEVARTAGFRSGVDDVSAHGDPGYTMPHVARRDKVVSVRRREGRPGESAVTVIMALAAYVDANGFTRFEDLIPEEIPARPKLHRDRTKEIFLTDAMPDEVLTAWSAYGFVERSDVVGCFHPSELFAWVSEPDEDEGGEMYFVATPQRDCWADDDLRDHSLTVVPAAIGENVSENTWEIRRGVSRVEAWSQLEAAGYVPMPEDLREIFGF